MTSNSRLSVCPAVCLSFPLLANTISQECLFKLGTSLTLTPDPDPWTRRWTWWSEFKRVSSSVCSDQSGNLKPYQSISAMLWQERDWKLNLKKHEVSGILFQHLQVLHHRKFPAVLVETKTWCQATCSHVCGEELGTFPSVFVATKTGVLSQKKIWS